MYDKHVRRVGEDERERASLTATPQNLTGRAGLCTTLLLFSTHQVLHHIYLLCGVHSPKMISSILLPEVLASTYRLYRNATNTAAYTAIDSKYQRTRSRSSRPEKSTLRPKKKKKEEKRKSCVVRTRRRPWIKLGTSGTSPICSRRKLGPPRSLNDPSSHPSTLRRTLLPVLSHQRVTSMFVPCARRLLVEN